MAPEEGSKRLVRFSPEAEDDFVENFNHTAHTWGLSQAERYASFLLGALGEVAANPRMSKPVDGFEHACYIFVKWPKARYGHNIIFEADSDQIYVLRILHSSMDTAEHLG